nr:zinc finger, CCHC-type [Tanacetum cinerariifolium]
MGNVRVSPLVLLVYVGHTFDLQQNLKTLGAYDMLKDLKTLFSQQAEYELLQAMRELHACKQKEEQSVSSYVLKIKGYTDNLEHLGHPVSLNLAVSLIWVSLRKKYDSFVQNYNMNGMGKTVNEFKKRIEKLQQDGLLNSIDTKSFDKCISYLSGKMACKPYSHQVKRVKDLLGLIHTDICSPFGIVSRLGASYFVTFTDDFSPSGSLEDLELIQEEDTHPSKNNSSHHDEGDQEIDKPHNDIIPIRRIDYEETFSPVADIRAIRILIAIVALYDYEIWQMDVNWPSSMDISLKRSK